MTAPVFLGKILQVQYAGQVAVIAIDLDRLKERFTDYLAFISTDGVRQLQCCDYVCFRR